MKGEWFGAAANRLDLRGVVRLEEFLKLCRNVNPCTDERLTQRVKRTNRVFYDFTLNLGAPLPRRTAVRQHRRHQTSGIIYIG